VASGARRRAVPRARVDGRRLTAATEGSGSPAHSLRRGPGKQLSMTRSPTRGMRWSAPGWRATALATVGWVVLAGVGRGLLPRLTRWLQWPDGLTLRGRLTYAVASAALAFALTEMKHRLLRSREDLVAELREELSGGSRRRKRSSDAWRRAWRGRRWGRRLAPPPPRRSYATFSAHGDGPEACDRTLRPWLSRPREKVGNARWHLDEPEQPSRARACGLSYGSVVHTRPCAESGFGGEKIEEGRGETKRRESERGGRRSSGAAAGAVERYGGCERWFWRGFGGAW
jgi:hypothetical protein